MPKILFLKDKLTVEVQIGSKLPEIVDVSGASVPFGCRMGSCGTCRILIEEGMENLNARTDLENEMFDNFTSVGDNERLGCQIIINGDVTIQS